jgi:hypothetical protein
VQKKVGLWIDHKKAVIFSLSDEGAKIKRIVSESKGGVRPSGEVQEESVAGNGEKRLTGPLELYYDEVLSFIRDAHSILIFGPDEAKLELKKRLEEMEHHGHIVGIETVKAMTDNQIVSKIRHRFLQ